MLRRVTSAKPSLTLLRELTDENVLRALMGVGRLTRAGLAVTTGLSKPTVAESVRRLEALGLVSDTGERTTGRGGVGTFYALDRDVGVALAISVAPEGVVAEVVDAAGDVRARAVEPLVRPAPAATVARLLTAAARAATSGYDRGRVRAAVVSAADPVDRASGELVHLPDAPFLLGALSPVEALRSLVAGPITVDNDVNWAARSERAARARTETLDDFVYLYLDEGLGGAVVSDGEVRRGHAGLAGEIAHVVTANAEGRATAFITLFAELGLRHDGTTAIDVRRLLDGVTGPGGGRLAAVLARAVCGVLSAAIAFCDPDLVVLGGSWGTAEAVLREVRRQSAGMPRPVPVDGARVTDESSLAGARAAAVDALRGDILARAVG